MTGADGGLPDTTALDEMDATLAENTSIAEQRRALAERAFGAVISNTELSFADRLAWTTALRPDDRLDVLGFQDEPTPARATHYSERIGNALQALEADRTVVSVERFGGTHYETYVANKVSPIVALGGNSLLVGLACVRSMCRPVDRSTENRSDSDGYTIAFLNSRSRINLSGADLLLSLQSPQEIERFNEEPVRQEDFMATYLIGKEAITAYADILMRDWQACFAANPKQQFMNHSAYALWRSLHLAGATSGSVLLEGQISQLHQQIVGSLAVGAIRQSLGEMAEPVVIDHDSKLADVFGIDSGEVVAQVSQAMRQLTEKVAKDYNLDSN